MTIFFNAIQIFLSFIFIVNFVIPPKLVHLETRKEKPSYAELTYNCRHSECKNSDKTVIFNEPSHHQSTLNIEYKSQQIAKQTPVPIVIPPPTNINTKRILIGLGILPILIVLIGLWKNRYKK
jgi:hypothetical protein